MFRRTWFGGLESLVQFQSIKIELKLGLIFGTKIEFKIMFQLLKNQKQNQNWQFRGKKKLKKKKTKGYLANQWF
jgi:hypothetical protein